MCHRLDKINLLKMFEVSEVSAVIYQGQFSSKFIHVYSKCLLQTLQEHLLWQISLTPAAHPPLKICCASKELKHSAQDSFSVRKLLFRPRSPGLRFSFQLTRTMANAHFLNLFVPPFLRTKRGGHPLEGC